MLFDASNHTGLDDVYSRFSDGVGQPCDVRKRSLSQLTIGRARQRVLLRVYGYTSLRLSVKDAHRRRDYLRRFPAYTGAGRSRRLKT
jgi:hypothetical protein